MGAPCAGQGNRRHHTSFSWYPRTFAQARRDREELPRDERLALIDLTDIMLERHGRLIDDDSKVARAIGLDIRVWRRLKAALIARSRVYVDESGFLRTVDVDRLLPEIQARIEHTVAKRRAAACGRSAPEFQPKCSAKPLDSHDPTEHIYTYKNYPPNPPLCEGMPDPVAVDQGDPEPDQHDPVDQRDDQETQAFQEDVADPDVSFIEIWQAWPLPGRRREATARWWWRSRLEAGVPLAQLRQVCLERARDRKARPVQLGAFLSRVDLAGQPVNQEAAQDVEDRLALAKLDAGRIACQRAPAWRERANAVLGADGVLAVARRALADGLGAREAWERLERVCWQMAARPAGTG